jgi:prepilin-type N-terminal cleavage/methylation domain-containing protein
VKSVQKGFTLVEIAIVLVIIGLLLGGILKGQEMITQAKIKNVIGDYSGISAAFYGYQDRYRQLPGDDACAGTSANPGMCGSANGRWSTASPAPVSGDGNGRVTGYYSSTTDTDEARLWWQHLRAAGFVSGAGLVQPFNTFAGIIGVQTGDGGNGSATATIGPALGGTSGANGIPGLLICSSNLPDTVSIATDTQMDDGVRLTGSLRGQQNTQPTPVILADITGAPVGGSGSYVQNGTNVYTLCRSL